MIIFISLSLACWLYLAYLNAELPFRNGIPWLKRGGGDGGGDPPAVPTYDQSFPSWAKDLPQQQIDLYKQYINSPIQQPAQYQQASDIYSKLANYSPQQFQYPIADIQKALDAQQAIQYQQYQKQINPILASQGQYDSSYRTNLNSDFLKNQQAQSLGNTANLLTNQASQNYDLSKWLPQLQGTAAQGLAGIGTDQANIQGLNRNALGTGAQGLGSVFGEGLQLGNQEYNSALKQYQSALDQYNQQQQQQQALYSTIGMISPLGGAIYGGVNGGGQGLASSLSGTFDSAKLAAQLYGASQGIPGFGGSGGSSLYNPSWNGFSQGNVPGTGMFGSTLGGQTQSEILGYNTAQFR